MTNPAAGHAQATLSGRELALQRRQAMALHGKAAARAAATRAPRLASAGIETASSRVASAAPAMDPGVAAAMSPARARRLAMSMRGKAAAAQPASQPVQATQPASQPVQETRPASGGACAGGAACTCAGNAGATAPAAASQLGQGRRAAMQRRQAMATRGRTEVAQARPSGRVRARDEGTVAPKVEEGHTLAGQRVTGTQVERSVRVTGNEPGSCRAVTGTEYIGSEQFDRLCGTRPAPAAPKVLGGRTDRGQAFTGTLVDRPARVTGGEQGADRAVTGTRYLAPGVDSAPDKVGVTHTASGRSVTGTSLDAARRATGGETGDCREVTGTEYLSSEHFSSVCGDRPSAQPRKVSVMSSREGQRVTGSSLGQGAQVTGNEAGSARAVTGNQYFNAKDFGAVPAARAAAPRQAGTLPKSCGDERQGCTHVTASDSVSTQSRPAGASRQAMSIPARAVTGDRPGGGGVRTTGDERGACEAVTGTPYLGEDNRAAACPAPSRSEPSAEQSQSFSILTPGHAALGRERGRGITGSAMGTERITGPVNKAQGLITGTPEFRRHDLPQGPAAASVQAQPQAASRLSGEGSQQGARISGDVWMERSRVTGTEGPSARSRNPSMRGQPRGAGSSAASHRELERPQVAPSRVTGSSGTTERGAMVTVSGGARG